MWSKHVALTLIAFWGLTCGGGGQDGLQPVYARSIAPQWLSARVVKVADGDTVEVIDTQGKTRRMRMHGIDTPETAQEYGLQAKQALKALLDNKQVEIEVVTRDQYKREVVRIYLNKQDVNLAMIQSGNAWFYEKYAQQIPNWRAYKQAQLEAMRARRGLWAANNPVPPWQWRYEARKQGRGPYQHQ